jgi:hypothetical protein
MNAPLDLYHASREELVAVVVRQREQIADLERDQARLRAEMAAQQAALVQLQERVGRLLALLDRADGDDPPPRPTTMPGLKPATSRRPAQSAAPRKPRPRGYGRTRMAPTRWQEHAHDRCPRCGSALQGGTVRHRREVIELVPARVEVTEHRYLERRCPRCRGQWQPGPDLAGVVVGQGRLGIGLLSLIAVLREELRLPIRAIQWHLAVAERGGHQPCPGHGGGARGGRGGPDAGRYPRRPGAARGRDGVARGRAQWLCLDVQHPDAAPVHARRSGPGDAGRGARRRLRGHAGQRLLCRLHQLRRAPPILLGPSATRRR